MFIVGIDVDSRVFFGIITVYIGVPTAIKFVS